MLRTRRNSPSRNLDSHYCIHLGPRYRKGCCWSTSSSCLALWRSRIRCSAANTIPCSGISPRSQTQNRYFGSNRTIDWPEQRQGQGVRYNSVAPLYYFFFAFMYEFFCYLFWFFFFLVLLEETSHGYLLFVYKLKS